jgi:hypothetical protein
MYTDSYEYEGARVLTTLHASYLREFLETWRRAEAAELSLPATDDPNYASLEVLLAHVLGAAARYMTWMCEKLELPKPEVEEYPDPATLAGRADAYLESVLAAWDGPLRSVSGEVASRKMFESRWETPYCIDSMLEHAVMHPIRHSHQLEKLLGR